MEETNFLDEIKTWEHPPRYGNVQLEEKVTLIFLENHKGLFHHLTTQLRMPVKHEMIFGPSGNFIYRHHVETRVKLYSPREESLLVPLKYIDVSRTTHTNLDVKQERCIDDYWKIDGSRDLSDYWTGFTQFIPEKRNLQTDICGPLRDWRENSWHPGRIIYGQNSGRKWERMPSWRRSKSGHMKNLNSIRQENYEEFISLILRTRNLRRPSRMLGRNWKHPWLPLCFARSARVIKIWWIMVIPIKTNQNFRAFWKLPNHHEDHIAGKGDNSLEHKNFGSQIYSYALSYENSCSEGSGGQGMGKIWENFVVEPDQGQKKGRGDRWSKDEGRTSSFRLTDGHTSFEKCWIGGKAPKIQRSSCTLRWYCKRRFRILCSIHWTRVFSISNDSRKSHGYHIQIARLRWTRSRRSICLYPSKNGRCSQIIENSKIGVSRHLDLSTTTQMAKIMVQYGRSSRSSWAEFVRSSFGRTVMGKAIWENPIETWLGEKVSKLGMSLCTPWKGLLLSVYVDDIKLAGNKQYIDPMWKVLNKEVDLGELTSFLDHVHLGCTQRQREISKDIVDNYRAMFESRISAGGTKKLPYSENFSYFFMVLRYEGSCREMCGTILWVGEQDESTTLQSIYSMHRWQPLQRRRIEIRGRIVKSMLSNCSETLVLGTYWKARYLMVSEQVCTINCETDQSLWQTTESIDFLHSSYMRIQTILLCG